MTADGSYQGDLFNYTIAGDYLINDGPPKITLLRTHGAKNFGNVGISEF